MFDRVLRKLARVPGARRLYTLLRPTSARLAALENRFANVELGFRLAQPRLDHVEVGMHALQPRVDALELIMRPRLDLIEQRLHEIERRLTEQDCQLPALRNAMESAHLTARLLRRELDELTSARTPS